MSAGWLVNDKLTCIPGTETLWHYLLDWLDLEDHCSSSGSFGNLASEVELKLEEDKPSYILRNASYFGRIQTEVPTISFLQDCQPGNSTQMEVCANSDLVVFNSEYTKSKYEGDVPRAVVIPIGVDFSLFKPSLVKESLRSKWGIQEGSVLFVGADTDVKNFRLMNEIIDKSSRNFVLVMKDGYLDTRSNVSVFNRLGHSDLVEVMNCCSLGVCTSKVETQHLAGIEMGGCDLPILSTDVGIYHGRESGDWGQVVGGGVEGWVTLIEEYANSNCRARDYWLSAGLDLEGCRDAWGLAVFSILP